MGRLAAMPGGGAPDSNLDGRHIVMNSELEYPLVQAEVSLETPREKYALNPFSVKE